MLPPAEIFKRGCPFSISRVCKQKAEAAGFLYLSPFLRPISETVFLINSVTFVVFIDAHRKD